MAAGTLGADGDGLATVELAIRSAMTKLGASLLDGLLRLDGAHRGPRVDCGAGHQASFVGYRDKHLDTVLGPITCTAPITTAPSVASVSCQETTRSA